MFGILSRGRTPELLELQSEASLLLLVVIALLAVDLARVPAQVGFRDAYTPCLVTGRFVSFCAFRCSQRD